MRMLFILLTLLGLTSCAAPRSTMEDGAVHVRGVVAIDAGWLEQVACLPGTRTHESLVVVDVPPSHVHAMLLLMGHQPGEPGRWVRNEGRLQKVPPTGDPLEVLVKVGDAPAHPVARWIRGAQGEVFPEGPFVFAGSRFVRRDEGERYEADLSGSLVGLVTFGDETVAWPELISHEVVMQQVAWEVNTQAMPPPGTPVTLILKRPTSR